MAGVLEQLFRPQKRAVEHRTTEMSQKALELEAARQILAEVFGVGPSEVEEMIRGRFEEIPSHEACCEKGGLWPQEFWL